MIVERVNSGLARAKAKGVKLGRGHKKDGERSADEKRWGRDDASLPLNPRSRATCEARGHRCALLARLIRERAHERLASVV